MAEHVTIAPGERVKVRLPWSEVCMHLGVAGRVMSVELVEGGSAVQLYDEDGDPYSFPILPGEAGFYRDVTGTPYAYPEQ